MSSRVHKEYITRLEAAAETALGGNPNATAQERRKAEEFLLLFRRSNPSFDDCRLLIENSTNENVKFQAITGLREAIIRNWYYTDDNTRTALQDFTMEWILRHPELPAYLTNALIRTLSVMMKLKAVNQTHEDYHDYLHNFLRSLVFQGSPRDQLIACSLISNMMVEFSINNESTNMGITMEQHWICKKRFEKFDLTVIFNLTLEIFKHLVVMKEHTAETLEGLLQFLKILEQLLTWSFASVRAFSRSRRAIFVISDSDKIVFEPPKDWKEVVINRHTMELIFALNQRCRQTEKLSIFSSSCLAQLSSLDGKIVENDDDKCEFLSIFVTHFINQYQDQDIFCYEAINVANICRNLCDNFKAAIWEKSGQFAGFIAGLVSITRHILKGVVTEDGSHDDDEQTFSDAFEIVLHGWTTFASSDLFDCFSLIEAGNTIFEHYVKSHLAAPLGWRHLVKDDEIDELVDDDKLLYSSQLMSIAALARLSVMTSLETLISHLQMRVFKLEGDLQTMIQDSKHLDTGDSYLENLFEDIHWLIMIATFMLCDSCEAGEVATIPSQIMKYSISQKNQIDDKLTLQMLGSPEKYEEIARNHRSQFVDSSIHIAAIMLRLCHVSLEAAKVNALHYLSPEILSDLIYFLRYWVKTYIFFDESYFVEISPIISAAYGRDSEGARWCIDYVINFVCSVLETWSTEVSLLNSAADLLKILVQNDNRCSYVAKSEKFWHLGHGICAGHQIFQNHPPQIKQRIVTSVVLVGTSDMNLYQDQYWEKTLLLIQKRYQMAKIEIVTKKSKDSIFTSEFLLILDLFCGIAHGSRPRNCSIIFDFLSEILSDGAKIIEACHGLNENIVMAMLTLFTDVTGKQICYLPESKCQRLYKFTFTMLKSYASTARKTLSLGSNETEPYQDLSTIFQLLTHLLDREFNDISLFDDETFVVKEESNKMEACDVAIFGITSVFHRIDKEFLSYPAMCFQCYKLVSYLCEGYPAKVESLLPCDIFLGVLKLLDVGLTTHGNDVSKLCLEAIGALHEHSTTAPNPAGMLQSKLVPFVKLVFDVIMAHAGDMELLMTACETFYAIFQRNSESVAQYFDFLVKNQTDSAVKQRLVTQFNKLHIDPNESNERAAKKAFIKILEEVIFDIRGVLWVR